MSSYFKKFKYILNFANQFNFASIIIVFMLFGAILETFSIAMIFPLVDSLLLPTSNKSENIFFDYISRLDLVTNQNYTYFLILIVILIFLLKNIFLLFIAYLNVRFIYNLQSFLSNNIFDYYLRQDLEYHSYNHSSNLIRNTKGEVERFGSIIKITLNLVIELLVVFTMLVFLLFFSFLATMFIFLTLFLFIFLYYIFFKKILIEWGNKRQRFDGKIIKLIQDGIGSIQELKILNREEEVTNKFKLNIFEFFSIQRKFNFLNAFPRILIEMLAVLFFSLFIIVSLNLGSDISKIIPTIAVFTAVAFRLMPSFIRIINLLQQVRYDMPVIQVVYRELKNLETYQEKISKDNKNINPFLFSDSITFEDVSFKYPSSENYLFKNLSFKIKKNDFFGISGQSGVGKSTIISMLIGLYKPNSGFIKVDNNFISGNLSNWYKKIGYVPQKIFLTDDSLLKNIAFGVPDNEIDLSRVMQCIKLSALDSFVEDLPNKLNSYIGENGVRISGGQRQRIGIARALYVNPELLILDEATNEIDSVTESKIMNNLVLLEPKKTILIISHKKESLANCNSTININEFAI